MFVSRELGFTRFLIFCSILGFQFYFAMGNLSSWKLNIYELYWASVNFFILIFLTTAFETEIEIFWISLMNLSYWNIKTNQELRKSDGKTNDNIQRSQLIEGNYWVLNCKKQIWGQSGIIGVFFSRKYDLSSQ